MMNGEAVSLPMKKMTNNGEYNGCRDYARDSSRAFCDLRPLGDACEFGDDVCPLELGDGRADLRKIGDGGVFRYFRIHTLHLA
jgi:hypothetical protein